MDGGRESNGSGPVLPAVTGRLQSTGEMIVMSRLLLLQSKRILLASCLNKLRFTGNELLRHRVAELQGGADRALADYRKAVLGWASPETAQYWLVAHQSMIEGAEELIGHLRESAGELPQPDRGEVGGDIVRLEEIIQRWRISMVTPMTGGGRGCRLAR